MDCYDATKRLARAETAMLYTRFFLDRIEKGESKASVTDVRAGISSAVGILGGGLPFSISEKDALIDNFKALSKSAKPISSDLGKLKSISRADAAKFRSKMDRLIKKTTSLWSEVQNKTCRGK